MGELSNCPKCGRLFVKKMHDICDVCLKEEEEAFDKVYKFVRQRENRSATINEISEATGVDESLIMKFVKQGRLRTTHFPNLGYPCENCGKLIQSGKLCNECKSKLQKQLKQVQDEEERKKKQKETHTYYAVDEKYRRK